MESLASVDGSLAGRQVVPFQSPLQLHPPASAGALEICISHLLLDPWRRQAKVGFIDGWRRYRQERRDRVWAIISHSSLDSHTEPLTQVEMQGLTAGREDRYEYRSAAISHDHSREKAKVQRPRRARKHTINDHFRAANVARDRLTLPIASKLGIFSKGKASSPIKSRRRQHLNSSQKRDGWEGTNVPTSPLLDHASSPTDLSLRERKIPFDIATTRGKGPKLSRLSYHTRGKEWLDIYHHSFPALPDEKKANRRSNKSINAKDRISERRQGPKESKRFSIRELTPSREKAPAHDGQQRSSSASEHIASCREPRSSTPYIWSTSEPRVSRSDQTVEAHLLAVLHKGLSLKGTDDQGSMVHQTRHYYDLQDLKSILDAKKTAWGVQTVAASVGSHLPSSLVTGSNFAPSDVSEGQKSLEIKKTTDWRGSIMARPGNQFSVEFMTPDQHQLHAYRLEDDDDRCLSSATDEACGHADLSMDVIESDSNNQELFFKKLDARLQEIVGSEGEELTAAGGELEILETLQGSWHGLQADSGCRATRIANNDSCDRLNILQCSSMEARNALSTMPRGTFPSVGAQFSTESSALCNGKAPTSHHFLTGSTSRPEKERRHFSPLTSSRIPRLATRMNSKRNDIPAGFWRQHKLY
ncbi:hypothetical protein N7532_001861 [Penicillium argentinense]|uniref:Uncharacterized protein n=1 Tax=Penicillium argentinense TaxID=1131581 RepID=A0A9W9G3B0_9EURO|nr:uncharacterized protein N7532_001861 [Penicillium argentinense]KAJ5111326.1 hypothetical protein N7532_001861 [Penicillium argentinense]